MGDVRVPTNYYKPAPAPALLPSTTERWARAEKATCEIIYKVLPTDVSEETRRDVIDYIYRLIRTRTGCEVFPYGSVPLRTYLPDGDIDLTAFGGAISEDLLADEIFSLLEREERNRDSEFIVKDVQLIRAEVKIVKCIVQNVVVDISLNQIGGLCTLCFLEQVDRLIGKDHLFKRSIILIKAWCYYESRILGAPHGLISTYALETLVLYIFNLFHSALEGPLAVLYIFLEHFSKFDWDSYCISLNGPVFLASFPELRAETPENGGVDLFLSSKFIKHCVDMYSVPSRGGDLSSRTFQLKHLNIIDPLKVNNNLGRSVSKGNFYRIRSAFTFGARKLGRILLQPEHHLNEELKKFFANTLERHGSEQRPDVHGGGVTSQILLSETEICPGKMLIPESNSVVYVGTKDTCQNESSPSDGVNHIGASTVNAKYCEQNGHHNGSDQVLPSESLREPDRLLNGNVLDQQMRMLGDAIDLATDKSGSRKKSSAEAENRYLNGENVSSLGLKLAPDLYISRPSAHCKAESEKLGSAQSPKLKLNTYIGNSCVSDGVNCHGLESDDGGKDEAPSSGGLNASYSATKTLRQITEDLSSASEESSEYSETPSDLTGDYDTHLQGLQYARWCFEYTSSAPAMPISSPSGLYQFQKPWVAIQHSSMFTANDFSHSFINGVIPSSPFYPLNPQLIPGMNFGSDGMQKPRGTGTYFPNPNRTGQVARAPNAKERHITSSRPPGTGRSMKSMDTNMLDQNSRKLSQSAELVEQSRVKLGASNNQQTVPPHAKGHSNSNGLAIDYEGSLDFGSLGHVLIEAQPVLERSRQWQQKDFTSAQPKASPTSPTGNAQTPKADDDDRVSKNSSYRLKDDGDFPPLSV